ncbi:hypothetical protein [Shinella sp.]|uniref:hypothetical protein n=1 Tax=Shinella sp. TaxID=1870904 RepID=UPI003F6E9F27
MAATAGFLLSLGLVPGQAKDFTAGIVANEMKAEERYPFMAGIVEGLAYARYAANGKDTAAMRCIYDWFYENKERPHEILVAFKRFPDYTAGAVVAAMLTKECGR